MVDTNGQSAGNVIELAWFGGFFDGEGTLILKKRHQRGYLFYAPHISVTNTHYGVLMHCSEILKRNLVGHYIYRHHLTVKNPKWHDAWRISVEGMKRAQRFLDVFSPYLVAKAERAAIMREYLVHRFSLPVHAPVGEIEARFHQRLSQTNTSGSPETARDAPGEHGIRVKIQSTPDGNIGDNVLHPPKPGPFDSILVEG